MFLLFLTFMVLKLTNVIAWSWWWVTAPLWGGIALVLGIFIIGGTIAGTAGLLMASSKARKRAEFEKTRAKMMRQVTGRSVD